MDHIKLVRVSFSPSTVQTRGRPQYTRKNDISSQKFNKQTAETRVIITISQQRHVEDGEKLIGTRETYVSGTTASSFQNIISGSCFVIGFIYSWYSSLSVFVIICCQSRAVQIFFYSISLYRHVSICNYYNQNIGNSVNLNKSPLT